MLKSQLVSLNDLKEAASIQKRQRYEEERKARIFNAKQRLFGQDYDGLEKQVAEKKKRDQIDAEKEKKSIEETQRRTEVIHAKEKELAQERARYQNEIDLFRCEFQRKEDRREFDLNDPYFHKNSKPARGADNDTRLGISSAQVFVGEDLNGTDRKKAQKEQLRSWLEQQIREKKQAEQDRTKADFLLKKALEARDKLTLEQATIERNNQLKMQYSILDYNKKMANEQNERKKLAKKHEEEDNLAEIYNMLSSDMLTENPDVANSRLGLNKKIAFLYRGMTPNELEHFKREQFKQVEANSKKKTEEKIVEKIWEQQDINLTKSCLLKNLELSRKSKAEISNLMDENKKLALEQKNRQEFLDKKIYTNRVTDEFYDQFNRTTR